MLATMGVASKDGLKYELHPIVHEFADFTAEELRELETDIRANGLCQPASIWRNQIVDGRHRAMVCERIGLELKIVDITDECPTEEAMQARVRSLNQYRRSQTKPLSNAEKRAMIKVEIEKDPARSDRAIARDVGVDHVTVGAVRRETGELVKFTTDSRKGSGGSPKRLQIEAELQANPNRTDAVIAEAVDCDPSYVAAVRRKNQAKGAVPIIPESQRIAPDGKLGSRGSRLRIPADALVSDLCRQGLQLENSGIATAAAGKQTGLGIEAYRQARAIILLSERPDLTATQAATVQKAIALLDETRKIKEPYALVAPLVEKVFGTRSLRDHRSAERRIEAFRNAIEIISEVCTRGTTIPVPHLSQKEAVATLRKLDRAMKAVGCLKRKVNSLLEHPL